MKGALWSLLGLTLLQAALSGRTNTGRIGELATSVSDVLSYVIDPSKPAIPDRRTTTATTGTAAASTAKTTTVAAPHPLQLVSPNSSSNVLNFATA